MDDSEGAGMCMASAISLRQFPTFQKGVNHNQCSGTLNEASELLQYMENSTAVSIHHELHQQIENGVFNTPTLSFVDPCRSLSSSC